MRVMNSEEQKRNQIFYERILRRVKAACEVSGLEKEQVLSRAGILQEMEYFQIGYNQISLESVWALSEELSLPIDYFVRPDTADEEQQALIDAFFATFLRLDEEQQMQMKENLENLLPETENEKGEKPKSNL